MVFILNEYNNYLFLAMYYYFEFTTVKEIPDKNSNVLKGRLILEHFLTFVTLQLHNLFIKRKDNPPPASGVNDLSTSTFLAEIHFSRQTFLRHSLEIVYF